MPYTQEQKEFLAQRPANVITYEAVEFAHIDFGTIRLVANQFSDQVFEGNTYQAVSMRVPKTTSQGADSTRAGSVVFGRIGTQVRSLMLQITPANSINTPITATIIHFQNGTRIYERRLYVDINGVTITSDNVEFKLSVDNPAKLSNQIAFYDPSLFIGLQSL